MRTHDTTTGSFEPLAAQRVRIGARTVTFRDAGPHAAPERRIQTIWDPSPPSRWKPSQLAKYRRARDAFVARLDLDLGCQSIVLDPLEMDPARTEALGLAAEALLKARAAGVAVALEAGEIQFNGDRDLVEAWEPALRPHSDALVVLMAARRRS